MKKLCGLLCALALAAFVPMCAAADEAPAAEKAAPAVTAPAAAAPAPATTETPAPAAEAPAPATTETPAPAAEAPAPAAPEKPAPAAAKSDKEKMSYAVGVSWGTQIKTIGLDVDLESLFQGIRDSASGHKLALSDEEIQSALETMRNIVNQKREERMKEMGARMKEMGEKNKVEGPKFLEENKKKEGVKTLASGLQYKVLKEGQGSLPEPTDTVIVNYRGMFIDGTEFDSSTKHGKPLEVPLEGGFIPGLTDALKLMKVGSEWMVYIPADLAYKDTGMFPVIGPNAVLIFDVEVLGIKEKSKEAAEPAPTK